MAPDPTFMTVDDQWCLLFIMICIGSASQVRSMMERRQVLQAEIESLQAQFQGEEVEFRRSTLREQERRRAAAQARDDMTAARQTGNASETASNGLKSSKT